MGGAPPALETEVEVTERAGERDRADVADLLGRRPFGNAERPLDLAGVVGDPASERLPGSRQSAS